MRTEFTSVKIAEFAPIPNARVKSTPHTKRQTALLSICQQLTERKEALTVH